MKLHLKNSTLPIVNQPSFERYQDVKEEFMTIGTFFWATCLNFTRKFGSLCMAFATLVVSTVKIRTRVYLGDPGVQWLVYRVLLSIGY